MRRMITKNQLDNEIKSVKKDITTLVDANGNDRFIEGPITLAEGQTQIEVSFGKWSLSGTHLMLVIAGQIKASSSFSDYDALFDIELPSWILDKIIPVKSTYVDFKTITGIDSEWASQQINVSLLKDTAKLEVQHTGIKAYTYATDFRLVFDILIPQSN